MWKSENNNLVFLQSLPELPEERVGVNVSKSRVMVCRSEDKTVCNIEI